MRLALNLASNPSPKSAAFVYFVIYPEPPDYVYFPFASNQDNTTKATLVKLFGIRNLFFFITAIHVADSLVPLET